LIKKGIVKKSDGKHLLIQVYKNSSCGHCQSCSEGGKISEELNIKTNKIFKIGTSIEFEIEDKSIFNIGVLVYIIPIFSLFFGYFVGVILKFSEGINILLSFTSMTLCFYAIHIFDKYYGEYLLNKKITIK